VKKIPVIATVNTKEAEAEYLSERIRLGGYAAPIIDVSTLDSGRLDLPYPYAAVLAAAGVTAEELRALRRDEMVRAMGRGAGRILRDLRAKGELAGAIAIGGNQGTAIAAIAMRDLPLGTPRLIVSTVASGNIRPYIEDTDILMMFSVADFINNTNIVSRLIMKNAVAAVIGMAAGEALLEPEPATGLRVALTAFGNTAGAIETIRRELEAGGCEVVGFHASGAGGAAMESLIEQGLFSGVVDLTTHELLAEVCGGGADIYTPLRPRLIAAGARGIPQVVAPGALEYFCFGAESAIPAAYRGRKTHHHNPYNTNVRASLAEVTTAAEVMAERLNAARGPVSLLLPQRGFSANGREGGLLYEPETDRRLREILRKNMDQKVRIMEIDANINDETFAKAAAAEMLGYITGGKKWLISQKP
jgi:uncharacterized protein (UPF0261 family)